MPSLRTVIETHGPVLLIDAASSLIQVAWLEHDAGGRWETSSAEAGIGVFECVQRLQANPADAGCFVFCEGPGSILGIRTVAMAIRAWSVLKLRPMFAYQSLALAAHTLADPSVAVIADARRDTWHCFRPGEGLRRVPTAELGPASELAMPRHFRHWTAVPGPVREASYQLAEIWPQAFDVDLLHPVTAPDAYLSEEPSYVTWTPQVHRAPSNR